MRLSIIIPCYNEEKNIPLILERFAKVLVSKDVEVILVDNGSTDATRDVLMRFLPAYPFARTVRVDVNQGYGYGVLCGLHAARGEYLGWTHADMQTDPKDCVRALEIIEQKGWPQDIFVKGHRQGRQLFDEFFTVGMSALETFLLGVPLWDINAQPNILHRSFFEQWPQPPHDFSLDLFVLYWARQKKMTLVRFPVLFTARIHGQSSWNTGLGSKWKFIKRTLVFSWALRKKVGRGLHCSSR